MTRMTIRTDCNLTRLVMYEHSSDVVPDNGVGYLPALENIDCNRDRFIRWDG